MYSPSVEEDTSLLSGMPHGTGAPVAVAPILPVYLRQRSFPLLVSCLADPEKTSHQTYLPFARSRVIPLSTRRDESHGNVRCDTKLPLQKLSLIFHIGGHRSRNVSPRTILGPAAKNKETLCFLKFPNASISGTG